MTYLAHFDPDNGRKQSIYDHLCSSAELAADFADVFGAGQEARRCGMLHDIGKYSAAFQRRIRGSGEQVDHSTAGAVEAWKLKDIPAAFCVAGHHSGLPDGGTRLDEADNSTLRGRVRRSPGYGIEDYSAYRREINVPCASPLPAALVRKREDAFFFVRMLYSCLVDADWLDTEAFMKSGETGRSGFPPLKQYGEKLGKYIRPWLDNPSRGLGEKRSEILAAAIKSSSNEPGIFTLTAPTGSGKTVASMAFALGHAQKHDLRRIIYVIPYCSIIEQTQSVFGKIFGEDNVVSHYSQATYPSEEGLDECRDKKYLASENWDAPIILTTAVQFFESLFSCGPSRCRKLHNIAGSVLIFDEAQMLPVPFLRPCVDAIARLVSSYRCSAVLCTATQPALGPLIERSLPGNITREICPQREKMYELFRRVKYEYAGVLSDSELAGRLSSQRQVLCVVNRRDQAQSVYKLLCRDGAFHLSTAMCPADRSAKLTEIRRRLKSGEVCRVVSTSLIEAGVDVDFPVVFRALAGLDSIIQSGGRCNREGVPGKLGGTVYIFESDRSAPEMLRQNISAAKYVLNSYDDIASPEAVSAYFNELLYVEKDDAALDAKGILALCADAEMPYRKVDDAFHVIDSTQSSVYIPCKASLPLLDKLERFGPSRSLMRQLGRYSVGVYPPHFRDLLGAGALKQLTTDSAILKDESLYSDDTGLVLSLEEGKGLFS